MSFAHLNTPEALRPLREAGLRFLFRPSPQEELKSEASAAAAAPEIPIEETPQQHAPVQPTPVQQPRLSADILQQLTAKITCPCYSVWTYWDLGDDLLGTPSQERRSSLAALMRKLAWPKGSITFWPVALRQGNTTQPFVTDFWQAMDKIKPRLIVAFGEQAFVTLAPQAKYQLFRCEGSSPMLLPLPDLLDVTPASAMHQRTYDILQGMRR